MGGVGGAEQGCCAVSGLFGASHPQMEIRLTLSQPDQDSESRVLDQVLLPVLVLICVKA